MHDTKMSINKLRGLGKIAPLNFTHDVHTRIVSFDLTGQLGRVICSLIWTILAQGLFCMIIVLQGQTWIDCESIFVRNFHEVRARFVLFKLNSLMQMLHLFIKPLVLQGQTCFCGTGLINFSYLSQQIKFLWFLACRTLNSKINRLPNWNSWKLNFLSEIKTCAIYCLFNTCLKTS